MSFKLEMNVILECNTIVFQAWYSSGYISSCCTEWLAADRVQYSVRSHLLWFYRTFLCL